VILPASRGHNPAMSEEPDETQDDEPEGGNPWAKTSSGDADEVTDDDDE
jgi:hypothetical protein